MSRARLSLVTIAAALALACVKNRTELAAPSSKPAPGVTDSCPVAPEPDPTPTATTGPGPAVKPPPLAGKILVPPPTPGDSRFELAGCLAYAATEAEGARFPPPPVSRSAAPTPTVRINRMGRGVIISHDVTHACCLKADVTTRVDGNKVTLLEQLSGAPCRCMCASTIRTAVGLAPGNYVLSVQLAQGGNTPVVHEEPFTVGSGAP